MKPTFLVADLSNSRTKIAPANAEELGNRIVLETPTLDRDALISAAATWDSSLPIVVASVVPSKTLEFERAFPNRLLKVTHKLDLGVGINFPDPTTIGADRLANAAAAGNLFPCESAIVVDFGTAVTFDVLDQGNYIGGVIAPGLEALTGYLHRKTALLPKIELKEPESPIGKSTAEAMLAGAVIGYRGLVREILSEITTELESPSPVITATGGYADLIAKGVREIRSVDQMLTLEGIRQIGMRNL